MLRSLLILLSPILVTAFLVSAEAQWKFVKYFPDPTTSFPVGMNNTIAVDPAGRIWIIPYTGNTDSVMTAPGIYAYCWDIFVYNPDGTLYKKYGPTLDFDGVSDTLFTPADGYGMATGPDWNIVLLKDRSILRKINYRTGAEMAKAVNPIPGYASAVGSPGIDAAGEIFLAPVVPTRGIGPIVLSPDFSTVLAKVDTSTFGQYARHIAVSPNGDDVYAFHVGLGTYHYHSSSGTARTYDLVDTVFNSLVIESSAWQPKTGRLWVSSGNVTSGMPRSPYRGYAWYGFDMTNPDKPVLKDSILWNGDYRAMLAENPMPRGIAFSPSGDTAYVAAFNTRSDFCQMFIGKADVVGLPPANVPSNYSLSQNYPNPFNPSTKIDYTLKNNVNVTLKVYDILGRCVATLVNERQPAGQHTVAFDGHGFASGIYLYTLTTSDGFRMAKKMALMK